MHDDFIKLYTSLRNEYLLKTEALFTAQKQFWLADFTGHFQTICNEIVKRQNELCLSSISHIDFTMLYSNFLNRRYVVEVWVYGDRAYLDKDQQVINEYDLSFLFVYFSELWNKLLSSRKRYVGKVTANEITTYMIETLPDFFSYFTNTIRYAIVDSVENSPFINISKNKTFTINSGEYMAKTETIYSESKNKDVNKLSEWFSEHLNNKYTFGDYSCLDFSGKSFFYTDFRYAQFRRATLNFVNFEGSILIGSNFRTATMEGCSMDNCSIYEADFSGAILKKASFRNASAKAGLPSVREWRFVGFLPVSFRSADLTNADFTKANLIGADFTGAILDGADFTDAILDDAIFSDISSIN